MSDLTIKYYDDNAEAFYDSTVNADMSFQYSLFLKHLPKGAYILDLGCGSGRDSKHFIENGYTVEAIDGSRELCKKATSLIGQPVKHLMFQDLDYCNVFSGVWASASLLHVPPDELPIIFRSVYSALKDNGIFYVSFKLRIAKWTAFYRFHEGYAFGNARKHWLLQYNRMPRNWRCTARPWQ